MAFWNRQPTPALTPVETPPEPPVTPPPVVRRTYGAITTGLIGHWRDETTESPSAIARADLRTLQVRARALARNNPTVSRYLGLLDALVIGDDGVRFQSLVIGDNGSIDFLARQKIELAWKDFSEKVSPNGCSLLELERLVVRTLGIDGEAFLLLDGATVRLLDPLRIPSDLHRDASRNNNAIINGVEVDAQGAVLGYHLTAEGNIHGKTTFIPASNMIHVFKRESAGQYRGIPPTTPVMVSLELLHRFELAELAAAQLGAKTQGFFTKSLPDAEALPPTPVNDAPPPIDITSDTLKAFELPEGMNYEPVQSPHPNPNFGSFVGEIKREIAVGLGFDPSLLTGNFAEITFSAGKLARTVDLAVVKVWQQLVVRQMLEPLYRHWLVYALTTQAVELPLAKEPRLRKHKFTARAFETVMRPMEEASANEKELGLGLTSLTRILRARGSSLDAVIAERVAEQEALRAAGLLPAQPELPTEEPDAN